MFSSLSEMGLMKGESFMKESREENETFEKFHAELRALAGRCDFTNKAEIVCDIFIMNMRESDCQRKLSR